jgi:N,N'-diacetyllegionaminate synthase
LASVFDVKSLNLLNKLNVDFIKLPSSEIDNYFLLEALTKQNKKVIFSTGMSSLIEVNRTYSFLNKRKKLAIPMYCVSSYPTSLNEIDIENLKTIKKKYKLIGFSDHTLSNESSILASYFGCKFIEKHITLNKKNTGPDHSSSLNPKEFRSFVQNIRNVELILKKPKKKLEIENKILVRKYLVASKKIKIGEIFSKNNITAKRCGGGIETFKFKKIFKKRSKYNFKPDQPLKF